MSLCCIKHPTYTGTTPPVLSCKTCCEMFIAYIKGEQTLVVWTEDAKLRGKVGYSPRCFQSLKEFIRLVEEDEKEASRGCNTSL